VFSAHDLHHVESVCDRVAIMREGELAATGTLADIQAEYGRVEYRVFTDVQVADADPAGDRYATVVASMDDVEGVREAAREAGGSVVDIRTRESTLEDVFLDVAGA
jgi:ABC-2 type transport system ATP-binding protein